MYVSVLKCGMKPGGKILIIHYIRAAWPLYVAGRSPPADNFKDEV